MTIDEVTIAGALKKAIAPLIKIENSVEYLYEVNQVLNRFKTNLYKLMDESQSDIDPATLFNIVITGSREIINAGGIEEVVARSPITLRVFGTRGYGHDTLVLGAEYMHQIDISDVFRGDALAQVHSTHFMSSRVGAQLAPRGKELRHFLSHDLVKEDRIGMHMDSFLTIERRCVITMVMSGIIFPEALELGRRKCPDRMKGSEKNQPREKRITLSDLKIAGTPGRKTKPLPTSLGDSYATV